MAENIKRHITHIKSKVANQKPTSSQLLEGEVAVNYAKNKEFLSIKNESGDVVTFSSDNYYTEQKLGSGFTRENSGNTVTKVIEDNEKVISSALNALNEEISNLDDTYVTLDTNQTISGKKTFSETINIEDGMNVSGTSRLYGDVKMNKSLSVDGTTNLNGQTKMNGNLLMNGRSIMGVNEIEASGSLNAGDTTVSSINVQQTANVNGNLQTHNMKPMVGDIYDIGNPGGSGPESGDPKYYRTIYVRNVNDIPVNNLAQSKDVNYLIYNLTDVSGAVGGTNLSASWSGNCSGITELTDGMNIQIKIPVAGHASGVTISINGGEKHKCILNASTNLTAHYPQGAIIRLVYDANQSGTFYTGSTTTVTTQGVWKISDYWKDTNTDTIGYSLGYNQVTFKVDAPTHRYVILFTKDETTLTPVNSVSNNTGGTKTLTTEEFDPFGGIYYKSSKTDVAAGTTLATGTVWTQYTFDLRYSFNTTNTLIAYRAVYMVVVPQSNGKVKLHTNPISQTLPTTEDGLVYIYLGQAYNTTNLYLAAEHPLYQFKNGKLMSYTADDRINGYLPLSGGTMTNTNKVVNLNADLLDGCNVDYEGNANTVAIRTSSGSLKATYFNQSSGAETPTDNSYWIYANNDGNFRKSTRQNLENVLKPYEAKVQWGGGNFADGFGCIDAAMVDEFGANRTQFLDGEAVDVEYSRDSGVTWQDYGASTLHKKMFFSVGNAFFIGKNNPIVGSDLEKYQLRITINTGSYLYTRLRKFVINIGTRGSSGCWCTIDGRIQSAVTADVDEWTTFASGVTINGNSGYNVINTPEFTTYGNPSFAHIHYGQVRFTFGCTGKYAENQSGLGVHSIKCFGNGWGYPSNMARNGHLYTYDQDQNATFPNSVKTNSSVYANGFVKTNSNDNYFLLGGGGHVARSGYTSTVELTNYMTTSSTLPTDDNTIYTYNGKVVEKRIGNTAGGDDIIAFATSRDVDGLQMDNISVLMYSKEDGDSPYKYDGNFNLSTNTGDTTVQELRSIFGVHNATVTTDGLMSAEDKEKLDATREYIYITYSELKTLKQQNKLSDGTKYRITDFVTTTTQADTQSANHPFDIIVTATGSNTLSETAMAAKRNNDTYFSGSNLSAWDIKYCFENDTNRFGWADPTNGKGVIYYMKDEFSNEAPYDFKNIQFKRWKCTSVSATTSGVPESLLESMSGISVGHYHLYSNTPYTINSIKVTPNSGDSKFFYTFSLCGNNGTEDDSKTVIDGSLKAYGDDMYKNNVIREYMPTDKSTYYMLNNIVFKPIDSSYDDCTCNVFGKNCRDMTFGFSWTLYNSFGNSCYGNSFGYGCYGNSFGNDCYNNSFGIDCYGNSFGNGCTNNSFGNSCYGNSFGNECYGNSFGYECYRNSFENSCHDNSFGESCYHNSFEIDCYGNSFGNGCTNNSFGNTCSNNSFEDDCYRNSFGNTCTNNSFGSDYGNNSFGNYCNYNSFEGSCGSNSFGNNCSNNVIDYNCYNIVLGNSCHHITFNDDDGVGNVNVESGNMYITLNSTGGNNITIAKGVNDSSTIKTINHVNRTGKTTYQKSTSTVINV